MPASRKMDYYVLRSLVEQHPDWSHYQYAQALTEDNRRRRAADLRNELYTEQEIERQLRLEAEKLTVDRLAVGAAIRRKQDVWRAEGADIEERLPVRYSNLIPWKIPARYRGHWILQKMRLIGRMRAGLTLEDRDRATAVNFEQELIRNRQVVDVTRTGRPVVRPAGDWELDETGNLRTGPDGHVNITALDEPEESRVFEAVPR